MDRDATRRSLSILYFTTTVVTATVEQNYGVVS
ncbi:hypothetical protein GGR92_001763 [Spirosoma lacussanchae]